MTDALPEDIRELAAAQVEVLAETVAGLSDADLVAATRCAGWLVAHLLVHVRLGLSEHATSFAEPAGPDEPPNRDYVSYWQDFPVATEPITFATVRWHWANASTYSLASEFRRHFADTARAAAGMSRQAPAGSFRFQEHVMAAEDILAMWTVEWVVHQLDLTAQLPGRPGPLPEALELTTRTLDGLLGDGSRPSSWDDVAYALKGTGRVPLDAPERELLGSRAMRYPAFSLKRWGDSEGGMETPAFVPDNTVTAPRSGNRMLRGVNTRLIEGRLSRWLTSTAPKTSRRRGG